MARERGSELRTNALRLAYGDNVVIDGLSLPVPPRTVTALLGPNGSGKSTLLRGLARILPPTAGAVLLDGHAIHRLPTREVAQRLGLLPQGPQAPAGMTVRELVELGRHPHRGLLGLPHPDDRRAVDEALAQTGLVALADRPVESLSGGQRQRAFIALTLAQRTEILLLDEPTTFLDPAHQIDVLTVVRRLQERNHLTVVMVLHELNLASRFADHLVLLREGRALVAGPPSEVLTPAWLRAAYGVEADVLADPRTGRPLCVPFAVASDDPR